MNSFKSLYLLLLFANAGGVPLAFLAFSLVAISTSQAYLVFYLWVIVDFVLVYYLNQSRSHSDGEIPETKISAGRRDSSEDWLINRQLDARELQRGSRINKTEVGNASSGKCDDDKASTS